MNANELKELNLVNKIFKRLFKDRINDKIFGKIMNTEKAFNLSFCAIPTHKKIINEHSEDEKSIFYEFHIENILKRKEKELKALYNSKKEAYFYINLRERTNRPYNDELYFQITLFRERIS